MGKDSKNRQHVVPKTYLKHFANEYKQQHRFWVYDKKKRAIYGSNIDNAPIEKDFYTINDNRNKYIWDDYYTYEIEPVLGRLVKQINNLTCSPLIQNRAIVIQERDRLELSRMMFLQLLRGRNARHYLNTILKNHTSQMIEETYKRYDKKFAEEVERWTKRDEYYDLTKSIMGEACIDETRINTYAALLAQKNWIVLRIDGDAEFITSDNPVLFYNNLTNDVTPFANGLLDSATMVYYPISSKVLIMICAKESFFGVIEQLDARLVLLDANKDLAFINACNQRQIKQSERQSFAKTKSAFVRLDLKNVR